MMWANRNQNSWCRHEKTDQRYSVCCVSATVRLEEMLQELLDLLP